MLTHCHKPAMVMMLHDLYTGHKPNYWYNTKVLSQTVPNKTSLTKPEPACKHKIEQRTIPTAKSTPDSNNVQSRPWLHATIIHGIDNIPHCHIVAFLQLCNDVVKLAGVPFFK